MSCGNADNIALKKGKIMKVLIIGGMGVIGGAITEAAVRKGMDVFVLSRRPLFGKYKQLKLTGIQGDWQNDELAKNVVSQNFDVIVDTQIFFKKQLIRSLNIVNGYCKQFIYISTDSVYVHPGENVSEDISIDFKDLKWWYGYHKRDCELYLINNSNKYSFFWTAIRPTVTFGDTRIPVGFASKRNNYTLPERLIQGKPIILFDKPETRHSICHVSIFGDAATDLFLNSQAERQFYHISDDYNYTYSEIFSVLEKILGVKGKYVHLSSEVLKKYSKGLYEEMIYDKDPTFTLDNKKIKTISPRTDFHSDLEKVLTSTLSYLKLNSKSEDKDYNLITDTLLLKNRNQMSSSEEKAYADEYIKTLNSKRIAEINSYDRKQTIKFLLNPMNRLLHFIIKPVKYVLRPVKHFITAKKNNGGKNASNYTLERGGDRTTCYRIWTGFLELCYQPKSQKRQIFVS